MKIARRKIVLRRRWYNEEELQKVSEANRRKEVKGNKHHKRAREDL